MADIAHQHFVIMGKPRNRPGQMGLVSTLADINDIVNRRGDAERLMEMLKAKAALALGGWIRAKPDWLFVLKPVPKQRDYPSYSAYQDAMNALYD
jgi:hypothetical protein